MLETSNRPLTDGIHCHTYRIAAERSIPVAVLSPEKSGGPVPAVLIQHGGGGHKLAIEVQDLAERVVRELGWCVVAIDGPVHGERRSAPQDERPVVQREFLDLWQRGGTHVTDMVADWTATIEALANVPALRQDALFWVGVSMGTAYGLPLLAIERRIQAAVLGMWGLSYPRSEVLAAAAAHVTCPVLFQQKWDDDIFDRAGQLDLFDAVGSADKRLAVYPGKHVRVAGEQMDDTVRFLRRRLAALDGEPLPG